MIQTERLVIQPFSDRDTERMMELFTNEIIKKTYMIPDYDSMDKVKALFARMMELSQGEERYVRGIYCDDTVIGMVNDVGIQDGKIEVGYMLDPAYHNKGYGTEMLKAVISYLFTKGYKEVLAGAFEENIPSQRVMEKTGMKLTDVVDEIEYRGKVHKCVNYMIKRG